MESVVVVARTLAISALLIGGLKIGPAVGAELQAPTPQNPPSYYSGPVDGVVGIEGGVVSGVINLESSGVGASDWRPRHGKHYQEV